MRPLILRLAEVALALSLTASAVPDTQRGLAASLAILAGPAAVAPLEHHDDFIMLRASRTGAGRVRCSEKRRRISRLWARAVSR